MKKLTKEEMIEAAKMARKKWPRSFEEKHDGRPNFLPEEMEELKHNFRKTDSFNAQCISQSKQTPKKSLYI